MPRVNPRSGDPLVSEVLSNALSKIRLSTREERAQNFVKRAIQPPSRGRRHVGPAFGPANAVAHGAVQQAVVNEAVRAAAAVAAANPRHNNAENEEEDIMGPDVPRHRGGRHRRSTRRSKKSRRRSTRRRS